MPNTTKNIISTLLYQIGRLNAVAFIEELTKQFPNQVTFSSSFSYEDQVISHDILSNNLPVKILL
ncbi:MAG: hypothetical protein WDM90_02825 [Ferruginibacter sp.]